MSGLAGGHNLQVYDLDLTSGRTGGELGILHSSHTTQWAPLHRCAQHTQQRRTTSPPPNSRRRVDSDAKGAMQRVRCVRPYITPHYTMYMLSLLPLLLYSKYKLSNSCLRDMRSHTYICIHTHTYRSIFCNSFPEIEFSKVRSTNCNLK